MKNRVLILVLTALMFSCSNIFNSESHITLSFASSNRGDFIDPGVATRVELWISETFVDYELVKNPIDLRYYNSQDEDYEISLANDLDSSVVRYLSIDGDSVDFDITTGLTRNFTVRVEYEQDNGTTRVFYGTKEATIEPFTTTIPIEIKETPASKQEQWFSELDDFLNEEW